MLADGLKGMGAVLGVLQRAFAWVFSIVEWEGSNSEPPELWEISLGCLQRCSAGSVSGQGECLPRAGTQRALSLVDSVAGGEESRTHSNF